MRAVCWRGKSDGTGIAAAYDSVKQLLRLETDRPTALRQIIQCCRKGGTISVAGLYGGFVDKMPMGAFFAKGLTMHAGQTHVQKHLHKLLELIETKQIDTSFLITHRMALEDAPAGYQLFDKKQDGCIKIVINPQASSR